MAKVSIIVPVYKVEPYLHRCVDSILNQTFKDFELILVDDGSPDNCGVMCDEYEKTDKRIHVIHQKNGGLSAARNAGIDWVFNHSDCQWMTFIDSDDWIHARYLELLYNAVCIDNTLISMCLFQRVKTGDVLTLVPENPVNLIYSPADAFAVNAVDPEISAYAWGRLYHRSLFEEIRYPEGKLWEDLFTTHKLLFACNKISVVETDLYYYFINSEGIVKSPWNLGKLHCIEGFEELIAFFENREEQDIMRRVVLSCCGSIYNNIFWSQRSSISESEKKKVRRVLRKKLMCLLLRYRNRVGITMENYCHYYEVAFPLVFGIYRIGRPVFKYPNQILKNIRKNRRHTR